MRRCHFNNDWVHKRLCSTLRLHVPSRPPLAPSPVKKLPVKGNREPSWNYSIKKKGSLLHIYLFPVLKIIKPLSGKFVKKFFMGGQANESFILLDFHGGSFKVGDKKGIFFSFLSLASIYFSCHILYDIRNRTSVRISIKRAKLDLKECFWEWLQERDKVKQNHL